jgi:hypothetical protein
MSVKRVVTDQSFGVYGNRRQSRQTLLQVVQYTRDHLELLIFGLFFGLLRVKLFFELYAVRGYVLFSIGVSRAVHQKGRNLHSIGKPEACGVGRSS